MRTSSRFRIDDGQSFVGSDLAEARVGTDEMVEHAACSQFNCRSKLEGVERSQLHSQGVLLQLLVGFFDWVTRTRTTLRIRFRTSAKSRLR